MPINTAVKVYNQIIKTGHVTRGSIGISFAPTEDPKNQALLKVYGADHGVFVQSVMADGPAEKAGMKPQDVVTAINGKRIDKGQDLIDMVADSPLGSTLKFSIIRDKKPMTLSIVVGDRSIVLAENGVRSGSGQSDNSPDATEMKFGMSVQALRQSDRQNMNFKNGVMVASTEPGSFADEIGLQKGDVIVELNRQPVNSPEDVRRLQAGLKPGDAVAFHIMRQTMNQRGSGEWQSLFLAGTVPAQ
jgi:serine protease Do